ncbi:MAG: InlB B-repeat-containing protein [Spirochaetaceae bacterium]|jgi:uncharacterized repeat protein (TIGR02543 family)|nr:InlB B-repeat-containing protein [Spirochaetaceae bacterium]
MHKKAWFFKNKALWGIFGVMLVFGTIATGCPPDSGDPEPTTYTVTFNLDGGTGLESQTVEEGKTVEKPDNPTKEGNTFAAWYRDEAKTTLWNFDTDVVVQDTTIYAKWVAGENVPSYEVTFDADGGTPAPAKQTVIQGEKAPEPAKPTKDGYIFAGWYNGDTAWNFGTGTVTEDITLKAKWTEAVTVTFNTNGGSAIDPVTVAKGGSVFLGNYQTTKAGNVFDGWYKEEALTTAADSSLTVDASITLYAKWTSMSELEPYAGVWQLGDNVYLLQEDGTAWYFYFSRDNSSFDMRTWSTSIISSEAVMFNEGKTEFTLDRGSTFTKNSTETKTPAAATDALLGVWINGGNDRMELKSDKTAVFTTSHGDTVTLGYCVESDTLYLLTPTGNLVIVSIPVTDGKPSDFSKPANDNVLAGVWKLTEDGQDYYWDLKADGNGTFHTLGASVPVSFPVTENGKIDGHSYTISGDKLTLPEAGERDEETNKRPDIVLTKVTSVSGSGADGDPRLHGTWTVTQGGQTLTVTITSNGVFEMRQGDQGRSEIWKADGSKFYTYASGFSSERSYSQTYSISGSTLTISSGDGSETVLTKQ